jgi:NAD(P)-dependent dehydrogenase (short-subunit alcohol dehydrogenase family)
MTSSTSGPGAFDLGLAGRSAVVTGAGRGIGLAIVEALLGAGARVVAGSRRRTDALDALVKGGAELTVVELDLTEPGAPAELVEEAVAGYGGVDVLVNNVGAVRPRVDGFQAVSDADWDWAFTINFMAAVRATRAALPHLIASGDGRIVTVSMHEVVFHAPVFVGDLVSFFADTVRRGRSSITVQVTVEAERAFGMGKVKVTEAEVIYVHVDQHNRPIALAESLGSSEDSQR